MRVAYVELRRMALPEIADAERDAAGRTAQGPKPARSMALASIQPGVTVGGALADGERVGVRLQQSPVAECGDVLQALGDHGTEGAGRGSFNLVLACCRAGIAAQTREAAHGFGKQTLFADEAHVAVVQRIGKRRREAQAEAANEVLRLIAIEHDGVDDAQAFAARIEIQAQREWQPLARAI